MPVIYLKHPKHGHKVACVELEAVYDESNGWTRYSLDDVPQAEETVVNTLEIKRRRGRPPSNEQGA
jgi:hypothetical protein